MCLSPVLDGEQKGRKEGRKEGERSETLLGCLLGASDLFYCLHFKFFHIFPKKFLGSKITAAQEEGFSERTVLCFSKDRSPHTNDRISAIVTSQTFII